MKRPRQKPKPNLRRLHNMDADKRLTRLQAAEIMKCSAGTIAAHNYAGILPFVPSRPITVTVGDLKEYAAILANGHATSIRRTVRIKAEDCPTYSRSGILHFASRDRGQLAHELSTYTNAMHLKYAKGGRHG